MSNFYLSIGKRFAIELAASSFRLRLGRREILCCRDWRSHAFKANRLVACHAGVETGHLELSILCTWLVILSGAPGRC